jgi:hypothetical protein
MQIVETTLRRYRLRALRKWFDSVPPRPVASLATVKLDISQRRARKPIVALCNTRELDLHSRA